MKSQKKQKQKTYERRKKSWDKSLRKNKRILSEIDEINSKISNLKWNLAIDRVDLVARLVSDEVVGIGTSLLSLMMITDEWNTLGELLEASQEEIEANPLLILVPVLSLVAGATAQDFLYGKLWKNKSYSEIFSDFKLNKELKKQKNELIKKYTDANTKNQYVKIKNK